MMKGSFINLKETESTNGFLVKMARTLPSGTVVYTHNQTSGRGQRGNSWESEPDKNITMSILLKDTNFKPNQQFFISEIVSLAIVDVLKRYSDEFSIKWPNDIYYQNKKIGGILIEHALCGSTIEYSILGIGLNVNQEIFRSDAPNPVSLANITGTQHDVEELLREIGNRIMSDFNDVAEDKLESIHSDYINNLYRANGDFHTFILPDGTNIKCKIEDVLTSGHLVLRSESDEVSQYAFKEIAFEVKE